MSNPSPLLGCRLYYQQKFEGGEQRTLHVKRIVLLQPDAFREIPAAEVWMFRGDRISIFDPGDFLLVQTLCEKFRLHGPGDAGLCDQLPRNIPARTYDSRYSTLSSGYLFDTCHPSTLTFTAKNQSAEPAKLTVEVEGRCLLEKDRTAEDQGA